MKEKLSELLSFNACPNMICNFCEHFKSSYACEKYKKEALVDHLIQNGVTIQKWIPVTERLPEPETDVLVFVDGCVEAIVYRYGRKRNRFMKMDDCGYWWERTGVTHWMPFPEPPKKEGNNL